MDWGRTVWMRLLAAGAASIATPALAAGCSLGILADLPVTMEGVRASVPVRVNGRDTRFWLDSGAFFSVMSQARAAELHLPLQAAPFGFTMVGIGGTATAQVARIKSFVIAGYDLKTVEFLVGGSDAGNGFIGRNLLGIRDTEFDLAGGSVKLIAPHGCEHSFMTYWAPGKPGFSVPLLPSDEPANRTFRLPVMIDGTRLEAELDTGAATSLLSRSAARRAGIDLSGPGVVATSEGGIGGRVVKGWVVPVASVAIGDEQILRTHLEVADDSRDALPDMLLGADFIMAHHLYVARDQRRIYFTYTGGKPFRTSANVIPARAAHAPPGQPPALAPGQRLVEAVGAGTGDPATAAAFARRGAARASARDLPGALADLDQAIRLSPGTAAYHAQRARISGEMGDTAGQRADLDKALSLDGTNGDLLRRRAMSRLDADDRDGALADAEAAARVTPSASLAGAELAQLFVRLHRPARAIPMLDAVIAAHRDDARLGDLLHARCRARAIADVDLDKALADCNRAIRYSRDSDRLQTRDLVYLRQGRYAEAIADYDRLLAADPRDAEALFLRGQARIAADRTDAGKADQAAARAIEPDIGDRLAAAGIAPKTAGAPAAGKAASPGRPAPPAKPATP